jgi:DNA-binding transcriptional LysR family regulator
MIQDLTEELLSELVGHFSRSYPEARLEVTVGNSQERSEAIASGRLDLALLAGAPSKATPLFRREPLHWIGSEHCTRPPDGVIPLVACTEPCGLRRLAITLLEARGVDDASPQRAVLTHMRSPGVSDWPTGGQIGKTSLGRRGTFHAFVARLGGRLNAKGRSVRKWPC